MTQPARSHKIPGPDHPITIAKTGQLVRVIYRGETIAESTDALVMREASYPPVYYFPRSDVRTDALARTTHTSWCPYKGEASYFTIGNGEDRTENAIWSYETPFEAVDSIRERLAFYPNKVDRIEEV
jgi:uncharacterized protein (DUF427 family)